MFISVFEKDYPLVFYEMELIFRKNWMAFLIYYAYNKRFPIDKDRGLAMDKACEILAIPKGALTQKIKSSSHSQIVNKFQFKLTPFGIKHAEYIYNVAQYFMKKFYNKSIEDGLNIKEFKSPARHEIDIDVILNKSINLLIENEIDEKREMLIELNKYRDVEALRNSPAIKEKIIYLYEIIKMRVKSLKEEQNVDAGN